MSLYRHEDRQKLFIADSAFCATTAESEKYSALCQGHINRIPAELRLPERVNGGLDIHFLFARPNGYSMDPYTDTVSLSQSEFGDYRFSISGEAARVLLPRCFDMYLGDA